MIAAATGAGRMLITLDRGMADARTRPEGSHAGIVVLRIRDQSANAVMERLRVLLDHHDLDEFAGSIVVVREHLIRIRRAPV